MEEAREAIYLLLRNWQDISDLIEANPLVEEDEELVFATLCETTLLSEGKAPFIHAERLSCGVEKNYQSLRRNETKEQRRILVDQTGYAFKKLRESRQSGKSPQIVNIFLCNAGFELLMDLILASFLLQTGLATQVAIYTTTLPFHYRCIEADIPLLLDYLDELFEYPIGQDKDSAIQNAASVDRTLEVIRNHLTKETITVQSSYAFCSPHPYWHMPHYYPDLFQNLQSATLTILKGDYHYRKLLCDVRLPVMKTLNPAISHLFFILFLASLPT